MNPKPHDSMVRDMRGRARSMHVQARELMRRSDATLSQLIEARALLRAVLEMRLAATLLELA